MDFRNWAKGIQLSDAHDSSLKNCHKFSLLLICPNAVHAAYAQHL